MIKLSEAPGKLYIAGEYAVLQPGQSGILVALNRGVSLYYAPAAGFKGQLTSDWQGLPPLSFQLHDGDLQVSGPPSKGWDLALSALRLVYAYLQALGIPLQIGHFNIQSNLMDERGVKYGFGSSGAVAVALIEGVAKLHQLDFPPLLVYKLAVISQILLAKAGSFGDIASSVLGGWLYYRSPDRAWLMDRIQDQPLKALVEEAWPGLTLESLPPGSKVQLAIAWTGSPASTQRLVSQALVRVGQEPEAYQAFLTQAEKTVTQLREALLNQDVLASQKAIKDYNGLLVQLAQVYQLDIFTPALERAIQLADSKGAAGKVSGAGGGDCGIALGSRDQVGQVYSAWQASPGIYPLQAVQVSPRKEDQPSW